MIKDLDTIMKCKQFTFANIEKKDIFIEVLKDDFKKHYNNSLQTRNILDSLEYNEDNINELEDFPFFPINLFKELELKSIDDKNIIKTLTSSGTTGQKVSKIFLDSNTALLQTKALASIISSYIGTKRLPMIIIDSGNVLKNRKMFSARGAGILGLANFGRDHFYLLDKDMNVQVNALLDFLSKHEHQSLLLFGFTFMVWLHFVQELKKNNLSLNITDSVLIHSGGWKKLESMAVNNVTFKSEIKKYTSISKVYNFYGMVEQVGSIYMECEEGYFHTSNFSEIIIRDSNTLEPLGFKNKGIIQTISLLPKSYPGNSILTEDEGTIYGRDTCKCGRKGTYFKVIGRIPAADLRGCSDTYADSIYEN